MSATFCPRCKTSTNVLECCGIATFLDEDFMTGPILEYVPPTPELVAFVSGFNKILDASRTPDDFYRTDRLRDKIMNFEWSIWELEKAGEKERANNLRTLVAQTKVELDACYPKERNFG